MKTSYYRRRNVLFSSPGRVVFAIALLGVVIFFLIRAFAPSAFFALTEPLFGIGGQVTAPTDEERQVQADRALMNENIALAERVKDLMRLVGDEPSDRAGVIAGVIARPPLAPYDTLIVGLSDGHKVVAGALVSAEGGVPVGTVTMTALRHAQVSLFSSAGRVTEGWVGDERLPLSLTGEGAGAYRAEIARDAELSEGAFVYVPGPGARPVGKVVRIDADPSSPVATLFIEPLVNIFSLTEVLIEYP